MRVGVAAHVDQQRCVVNTGALLLVEPMVLSQPQRDQALTEDVLHRLAEAEVDPQRKRPDQLRQSHVCAIRAATHALTLHLA
jgi:hypothetical protein